MRKKPVFAFLLAFLSTTVVFYFYFVLLGSGLFGAFGRITDGWILAIAVFTVYDLFNRLFNDRSSITKVYIAMTVLMLLSVFSFTWSTVQADARFFMAGIATSIFLGAVAGLLPRIVSLIKNSRAGDAGTGEKLTGEDLQEKWDVLCIKLLRTKNVEKRRKLLYANLLFKVSGNTIHGELDTSSPLILSDGTAYTVDGAEGNEALSAQRDAAIVYIDELLK